MNILEIIISSVALASDAFAVSISKGFSLKKISYKDCFVIALWFGSFQGLMPLCGYLFGSHFERAIESVDHFVAFILLLYIGGKMIYEVFFEEESNDCALNFKEMFMLAIATSIDAFSFGLAYSLAYKDNVIFCFLSISVITFFLSFLGVFLGSKFGTKFEKISKIIGGLLLIVIGINVLIDHLF